MATEKLEEGAAGRLYTAESPVVRVNGLPDAPLHTESIDPRAPENRSLGELFSELSADMSELLQKEVALAESEMMAKVSKIAGGATMAASGGMLAYAGVILLLIATSFFLTQWMAFWIASGLVAIVTLVVGLIVLQVGRGRMKEVSLAPEQTIDSLKADAKWAKEQVQ